MLKLLPKQQKDSFLTFLWIYLVKPLDNFSKNNTCRKGYQSFQGILYKHWCLEFLALFSNWTCLKILIEILRTRAYRRYWAFYSCILHHTTILICCLWSQNICKHVKVFLYKEQISVYNLVPGSNNHNGNNVLGSNNLHNYRVYFYLRKKFFWNSELNIIVWHSIFPDFSSVLIYL
jgi:hypothetical protein